MQAQSQTRPDYQSSQSLSCQSASKAAASMLHCGEAARCCFDFAFHFGGGIFLYAPEHTMQ
jgi:hypothetical protein